MNATSNNKAIAVFLLFIGGIVSALCFGVISLVLYPIGGGLGTVVIPLVIYVGVRSAERYRERYREAHGVSSVTFIAIAELPSIIISGVLLLLLMGNSEGGDLMDAAGELIGSVTAAFCGGTALLIMLGTVICSIVTYHTRKKILSQPSSAEETTEV